MKLHPLCCSRHCIIAGLLSSSVICVFFFPFLSFFPLFVVNTSRCCYRPVNILVNPEDLPETLPSRQRKLYRLIWCRAVASLMKPARETDVMLSIGAPDASLKLVTRGRYTTFAGFLAAYSQLGKADSAAALPGAEDDSDTQTLSSVQSAKAWLAQRLAGMQIGEQLRLVDLQVTRIDPPPPARYTEAGLVNALTKLGIGRPSTYASVLATLQVCVGTSSSVWRYTCFLIMWHEHTHTSQ